MGGSFYVQYFLSQENVMEKAIDIERRIRELVRSQELLRSISKPRGK